MATYYALSEYDTPTTKATRQFDEGDMPKVFGEDTIVLAFSEWDTSPRDLLWAMHKFLKDHTNSDSDSPQ